MAEETGIREEVEELEIQEEKKFTQAELDAIVNDRLRRERKKYADYADLKAAAESNKAEQAANADQLQQALSELAELRAEKEAREAADAHAALVNEVAKDKGVDAEYLPLLTADSKEELEKQADLIAKRFADPSKREGHKLPDVGPDKADLFFEWASQSLQR